MGCVSSRWKGRAVLCAVLLAGIVVVVGSGSRMHAVEKDALQIAQDLRGGGTEFDAEVDYQTARFALGDAVDVSGLRSYDRVVQGGVTFTFGNPRMVDEETMAELCGVSAFYPSGEAPLFVLVDLVIQNESDEATPALWFSLESGSLSVPCDESFTGPLNGYSVDENYQATNEFYWRAEPRSSQSLTLAFELAEYAMSKGQWDNVRDAIYSLVYVDYPNKIVVDLGTPKEWQ